MVKLMVMRSLCRSVFRRAQAFSSSSSSSSSSAAASAAMNHCIRHLHYSSPSFPASSPTALPSDCLHPLAMCLGGYTISQRRCCAYTCYKRPEIERAFKDLTAMNWDEIPLAVVDNVTKALSKNTEDKAAQEVLKNVFQAAEAVEEFTGLLISLKMEMDDIIGLSGENVKPLPEDYVKAMQTIFDGYASYLAAFGPEESYLKKKVETELGTKMIYLEDKMQWPWC